MTAVKHARRFPLALKDFPHLGTAFHNRWLVTLQAVQNLGRPSKKWTEGDASWRYFH